MLFQKLPVFPKKENSKYFALAGVTATSSNSMVSPDDRPKNTSSQVSRSLEASNQVIGTLLDIKV